MANRTLEWMIRLVDRVSGPAKQADSALGRMQRQVEALKREAAGGNAGLDKMVKSVESATGAKVGGAAKHLQSLLGTGGGATGKKFGEEFGHGLTKLLTGVVGNEAGEALSGIFGKVLGSTGMELAGMATGIGAVVAGAMALLDVFKEVAHAITEGVTKLAEMTLEASKFAVETAAFKESSLISMGTVLGSDTAAQKLFNRTVKLSAKLPIGTKEALDLTNRFAVGGFSGAGNLRKLTIAASDVNAMRGHEGVESFISQLVDINSIGLQMGHLNTLARGSGIRTSLIFDQLRKLTGKTGSDHAIEEMIAKGEFSRSTAIKAIVQALAVQEHGPLGTLSVRSSKTFEGLLTRMKSVGFNMFLDFNQSKAFGSVKGAMGNLVGLLSPTSSTGKAIHDALRSGLGGIIQAVFGGLSGPGGKSMLKGFLGSMPGFITHVTKIFTKLIKGVETFVKVFVAVVGPSFKAMMATIAMGPSDGWGGPMAAIAAVVGGIVDLCLDLVTAFAALVKPFEYIYHYVVEMLVWIDDVFTKMFKFKNTHPMDPMRPTHEKSEDIGFMGTKRDEKGSVVTGGNMTFIQNNHFHGDVVDPDRFARRLDEVNRRGMHGYHVTHAISEAGAF